MRGVQAALAATMLIASITPGLADNSSPFIYFATEDPFAAGQPTKNDIYVFSGVFATGSFGDTINVFGTDYTDSYMIGAAYGRDFADVGAGFVLGGVTGAAIRFGEEDDTSGELWAGMRLRHQGLVIGDLAIAPALTAGFSAVTGPTEIERNREIRYDGDASFLGFIGAELSFRVRQAPNVELVYQLHHRSGADGTFGDMKEGSNANVLGIRYRF
ncbi:hypothetical protein [Mesorhizobium sp.]|uniref:hypothetical protein n=1 Tax=Mesorhizobium sp. TaxID=1871066 RepID=UPI001211776F|nr:hypothetical protein [Mesorhizobium sp.]TIO10829.1 MAG: hypothetical protein E5X88_03445 [Mesorhizobium sp.]TIO35227.1 MAG: hypothetical protein E5X89_08115 [Mesorhizobium sp.]TIP13288.1 MAG: hypothetical protein E5X73_07480 [Mesorhizobium sp.]